MTRTSTLKLDRYCEGARVGGKCSVCGDTKRYKQTKNPKYFKPNYFTVFEKNDWFRGNDTYCGVICKKCIKAGLMGEAHKQSTPPNKGKE